MDHYKECPIETCIHVTSFYTAFEAEFDKNYFFNGEAHDFWELVYAKNGSVGVVANDSTYILSGGQMIFHPPMEFHRIWSEGNEKPDVIIMSFSAEWENYPQNRIFNLSSQNRNEVENILEEIKKSFTLQGKAVTMCNKGFEANAQITVNKLENLLLSLTFAEKAETENVEIYNKKYAQIVNVLSENLERSITIDEIAQKCNMSASSLKTMFFKYSGMGIKHYFNEMKAQKAARYLYEGYSVKETAALLGFQDQNYFSAFFKRIMGVPPSDYVK